MKKVLLLISLLVLFVPSVHAKEKAVINVFYRESCSHCMDLHSYLDVLSEDNSYKDMFTINYMEVSDKENNEIFKKVLEYFHVSSTGVPFYVIGEAYNMGFPNPKSEDANVKKQFEARSKEIKDMITSAYVNDEKDIVKGLKEGTIEVKTTKRTTTTTSVITNDNNKEKKLSVLNKKKEIMEFSPLVVLILLIISSLLIIKRKRA